MAILQTECFINKIFKKRLTMNDIRLTNKFREMIAFELICYMIFITFKF
jgi:hypothetical protein